MACSRFCEIFPSKLSQFSSNFAMRKPELLVEFLAVSCIINLIDVGNVLFFFLEMTEIHKSERIVFWFLNIR